MEKLFSADMLKQLGISAVFAALLILYNNQENQKWQEQTINDQKRWEQLFEKYSADQERSLEVIRACCMDIRENL